jgi:ribosomal protein L37E
LSDEIFSVGHNRGKRIIEFYICPKCGSATYDLYTLKASFDSYCCKSQCRRCGKLTFSVDSSQRCEDCSKLLECLYEDRPLADLFAMSLRDLRDYEVREILVELDEQLKRFKDGNW